MSGIIVIGSTGRIGAKYCSHLRDQGKKIICISRSEKNICNKNIKIDFNNPEIDNLRTYISNNSIGPIIHFATTNVLMKESLEYHEKINLGSVKILLDLLDENNINTRFIYTSTDLVFDSKKEGQDETSQNFNPKNNYAKSKLKAEKEVLKHENGFVVRFGNVIGIENDFLTAVIHTIKEGKGYNAWGNVFNRYTFIKDILDVLDKLLTYDGNNRVFHVVCNDPPINRYDFIKEYLEITGKTNLGKYVNKTNATEEQLSGRPQYSILNSKITERELGFKPKSVFDWL